MAEMWSWGVTKNTEEEQKQINAANDAIRNGGAGAADAGYYSGPMGEPEVSGPVSGGSGQFAVDSGQAAGGQEPVTDPQAVQSPATEPAPSKLWLADPGNFAEVWSKYDQDPDYQDEHWSRDQIETLYEVYNNRNQGKPMEQWSPLMDDDPYITEVDKWWDPVREEAIAAAGTRQSPTATVPYTPRNEREQAFFDQLNLNQGPMDYNALNWQGKFAVSVMGNAAGMENMPGHAKATQSGWQAMNSAMSLPIAMKVVGGLVSGLGGEALAGAMTNPWVLLGAGVVGGGLAFYQSYTGNEIPVFNKFLEISDMKDTLTEKGLGWALQAGYQAKQNISRANEDPNDAYGLMAAIDDTIRFIGANSKDMWDTGEFTYETFGGFGDAALDLLNLISGREGTKSNEGWFYNQGLNEKQTLAEGTYNFEGLETLREMRQHMKEDGLDDDTIKALMQQIGSPSTSAEVSDYTGQMALDIDLATAPLENYTAGAVSHLIGDQNGIRAFEINRGTSILSDMPVLGDIYNALYRDPETGKRAKQTGGITEYMDIRKDLARTTDVTKLNAVDRIIGGIDKDGKIKDFNKYDQQKWASRMVNLLPESQVTGVGNIANNVMNAYLYDVKDVTDLRNRLASLAGDQAAATGGYVSGLENSADLLTVRDGIRNAINTVNPEILIKQYESSEGARTTLQQMAKDLGMEVKDVLSLYEETPSVFEQRARDYAAEHNGMFGGLDITEGVKPVTDVVQAFSTRKDGQGKPLAWNIQQLQYAISTSMIDAMAKYYTEYYGVQPTSVIQQTFDTMKSAQSLLLLGWSPGYFVNNVINNAVTSVADGVFGLMTPTQIRKWMEAFGVTPARMDVDLNAEFRGQSSKGKGGLEAFSSAVSEAKKKGADKGVRGVLTDLNGVLRKANDKLGVFSTLSGKMETLQGNQLTAVSIQQYWGNRWKAGEGFHRMPKWLEDTIERQTPGMTDAIYLAVAGGLNLDDISNKLYGTYIKPDVGTVMKGVVSELFKGEAAVYEEVLEKSGVMRELKDRFANCNTDEERAAVMADLQRKVDDYVANLRREDLISRANDTAAVVDSEGLPYVSGLMNEMYLNHSDFWIRQRQEWTDAYNKIKDEKMDSAARSGLLADLVAKQQKDWADVYKQEVTTMAGIMNGLGFESEYNRKYLGLMMENQKNWQDFQNKKSQELARAYERTSAAYAATEKGKKADKKVIQGIWDDFYENVEKHYNDHFAREMELQTKMDQSFVEGYEFSTNKSGKQLDDNFRRAREIRQQMHDMQEQAHRKTRDMSEKDKADFYEDFNPKYNALIRELGNIGDANATIIDEEHGRGFENREAARMTPDETVQATEVKETADAVKKQAMRERNGYLDREGIKQGWIDSGRTPAEADLMMAIYDAAAETWAKRNGMYPDEFYPQAAQLKGIANWLPGVEDQGSGGKDYTVLHQSVAEYAAKYHDQIMQHYGNENFRKWFGNSKVVDEYGLPLVVHHGATAKFEIFSKEKLGSNTGAESAKMGFFFAGTEETASHYINTDSEYGRNRILGYMSDRSLMGPPDFINNWSKEEVVKLIIDYKEIYDHFQNIMYQLDLEDGPSGYGWMTPYDYLDYIADNWENNKIKQNLVNDFLLAQYAIENEQDLLSNKNGQMMDVYLSIQNPFVFDYKGNRNRYVDGKYVAYSEIVAKAKAAGHDGVILKNTYDGVGLDTIYVVFEPTQIKSIENDGTFNKLDPNILHQQAVDSIKGTFEHTDMGNIIRMLQASDVSTMVHESGHLFRRTLSTDLMKEFTQWAGYKDVAEFQELEVRYWANDPELSAADKQRYIDSEEKFARGFEQYLMDGSAPTPGLKAVFKAFSDYLLDIYQKVKATVTGNDYSKQGEFVFHGVNGDEVLNINAEINGVKLRDIFDRMLTDDIQRTEGYMDLIMKKKAEIDSNRHNLRMSEESRRRRAQVEITSAILRNFGSLEAAEDALKNYQIPWDINGMKVDDATLFEAIQAAKGNPDLNPYNVDQHHEVKGTTTYGYSIKDSNSGKKWQLQFKVVELGDLVASNDWFGDQLVLNENYPADYQARNRAADPTDVYSHAANLNPGLLIDNQLAIDSGAPIVGEGTMVVESGNGRVLSLQKAWQDFPESWQAYQDYLRASVGDYGIDPKELDSFENPVLIRERLGGDGLEFAEDANSNRNKQMSAAENSLTDANKVDYVTLSNLELTPGEGIDTFTTEKNARAATEWLRSLPESERNKYMTMNRNGDMVLSMEGKSRFTNALFATLYATPESMDIIRSFSETADSSIQALESALKQTLPEMARAEGLIRSGSRAESLSITADVMAAAGLLQDARKQGINIHDYLAQAVIPGMERWTPTQALLAGFFGDAKNNTRMLRDFFNVYGEEVFKSSDPNQLSLFTETLTREQIIDKAMKAALENRAKEVMAGGQEAEGQVSGPGPQAVQSPGLNQSVMDSDGKWSSEFAKTLNENQQRTFDSGMSIPFDQVDEVYLRGETNVKFDTNMQRWLRDFSNEKNLSTEQYIYALGYAEWWVKGSEGEAPKGNPLWEQKVQQLIMKDFQQEHPELIERMRKRYTKGELVDDTPAPSKGVHVKKVYEFEHGYWNIAGSVFRDGKLVAYLPEELSKMQRWIEVDGNRYQVLGVDLNDPDGLVYFDPTLEIVRTVTVGKPEGFDTPSNPFAFIKPARQGKTPTVMPTADAFEELNNKYLRPALQRFGEAYKEADTDARTKRMSGLDLQTRAQIEQWLDRDVKEDMRIEKYRAMKYSDTKKDAAMLNYSQRYGFDPMLTMINPYQFWYTRSMWKWAKRMIDHPQLGNAYERLQEAEDKFRLENMPSRLGNRAPIPMPFLSSWMGGNYYIDWQSQLFPFKQFGESYGSNMNYATLNARTEAILNEQQEAGTITLEEMQNALQSKDGEIWKNAYAQAEIEIGKQDKLDTLVGQLYSPNIFWSWYQDKMKGEDPGTLNSTRTGSAIRGLTSDVPMVSQIGELVGNAMALPEKALRKLYGFDFNEFGAYGDQQIRKQISQMVADGEIDWRKGLRAMNEKTGTIWEMAADRQRKEAMLKLPGFAGAEAAKQAVMGNASIPEAIGAMAVSTLGGGLIYPTGEQTLRAQKAGRDAAYVAKAAGDREAVSNWYKENPEYLTRQATYIDDPEELLKFTLYNNITNLYYAQPYAQQVEIQKQLGPEFDRALFNSETKNYKAVPVEKLAEWNAALGNKNPDVGSIDIDGVERVMQMSQPALDSVETYNQIKAERFPGITQIQNGYYNLPKDQRKAYLQYFPKLEQYWEWNRNYKETHQDAARWIEERSNYYNEKTCYNSFADMSQGTMKQLEYAKATGKEMSEVARYELRQLYGRYASEQYTSFDEYVKMLQDYE